MVIAVNLALRNPYSTESNERVWEGFLENGQLSIDIESVMEALEIMRGCTLRLELQTPDGHPLRTIKHVEEFDGNKLFSSVPVDRK